MANVKCPVCKTPNTTAAIQPSDRDVSSIGHWGNGDYEIRITSDDDLEYILSLVKQSLKKNQK